MSQTLVNTGDYLSRRNKLYCARTRLTNADLTAAALTQTIQLGSALPDTAAVAFVRCQLNDAFDSPGAGSLDLQVGDDTNDDDSLVAAMDLYTGSANEGVGWVAGDTRGAVPSGLPTGPQLEMLLTATTDNLSTFTNGDVEVEVYYWLLTDVGS